MTQAALAKKAGISRKQLQLIEENRNVSVETLLKVVDQLGLDVVDAGRIRVRVSNPAAAADLARATKIAHRIAQDVQGLIVLLDGQTDERAPVVPFRGKRRPPPADVDLLTHPSPDALFRPVSIEVEDEVDVAIDGYVAAGAPIDALEQGEGDTRRVPLSEAPDPRWRALIARGDSMIEFGIYDGDLVYVEPRRGGVAATGEIVIGWLNDGLVIKEWSRRPRRLISWNKDYPDRLLTPEDTWELQAIVRKSVPRSIRGREFRPRDTPKISG